MEPPNVAVVSWRWENCIPVGIRVVFFSFFFVEDRALNRRKDGCRMELWGKW